MALTILKRHYSEDLCNLVSVLYNREINANALPSFHCNFKGDRHCSDLTLGDHWGIQPEDETYHPAGVSLAIVHTSKGLSALYSMENAFIRKTDSEKALKHNPHYSVSVHMDREKQRVLRLYQKHGFLYAYYRRKTLAGIRESIARHTLRLFRKLQNHIKFK